MRAQDEQQIVVTGIGVVTSLGCERAGFWQAMTSGRSGVRRIRAFDPEGHLSQIASEVHDFDPLRYMSRKQARRMARVSQFAVSAAVEAVGDSGLDLEREDPTRVGCVIGTAAGDHTHLQQQFLRFEKRGAGSVNPLSVPRIIPNMPACNVAIVLGIHGPSVGITAACATGASAIGTGLGLLRQGRAAVVLAGGAESTITPMVVDAYGCMGVLSGRNDEPERASRPFDAERDGFVIGEGAGVLVLETAGHARQRGASVLAVLRGFAETSDAYNVVLPAPDGRWAAAAILGALQDAGVDRDEVGYVNAHGTSTQVNDRVETLAIRSVFGDRKVAVSSTKSMIGHTLGAAGAIEAAATVLAVHHGVLPPTINYETPDPDCDLDVVPNEAREDDVRVAISNAFGFGGQNAVLAFGRAR